MGINPTTRKLGAEKPGMRTLVVAAPSGYLKSLVPLPEGAFPFGHDKSALGMMA
jgi:hypothetical protein